MFTVPQPQEKTLKVLVFGEPKSGKSHFIYTATEVGPVMWQDTEHGSDYYNPASGHGFMVAYDMRPATSLEAIQVANEIDGIQAIVAIDSFSSVWYAQQEVAENLSDAWAKAKGRKPDDKVAFRAWGPAKKPLKALYNAIMLSHCHCILTARAKEQWKVSGGGEPELIGFRPDIERNLAYAVDIVLQVGRDAKGFYAMVLGSRSPKLKMGKRIDDPKFADLLVAMQPGTAPIAIVDDVNKQVAEEATAIGGSPRPNSSPEGTPKKDKSTWTKCPLCGATASPSTDEDHAPWCKSGPNGARIDIRKQKGG